MCKELRLPLSLRKRGLGGEGSPAAAIVVLTLLLAACGGEPPAAAPALLPAVAAPSPAAELSESPGEGFVVWESNRSGAWRLWIRELGGPPPRQLSPEEGDRQHCCPHVAPDGSRLAYLSLPRSQAGYPESGASGPLHLIGTDGEGDRVLVAEARTYFEHRAAVWKSATELIYIDAGGTTRLLDLATSKGRPLTERGEARHGWLVNSTLTHATTGRPTFSSYDAARRRIAESRTLGGCQPYFSQDGRWGFWVAGAGGPIRAIELASQRTTEVLQKSDPRLPPGQGYLYFPMLSHDSTLLAVAASRDEHDHLTSNYDVFVAATDPDTLEVLGPAWRVTSDPASDRFPDVYSLPLALGRHFGEAPYQVAFTAPGGNEGWQWSFDDGMPSVSSARGRHTFLLPASYHVEARRGEESLRGFVRVRPARPPEVVSVATRQRRQVWVHFDEEVDLDEARARFESGRAIARIEPGERGNSMMIELARDLDTPEVLLLSGVRDRAQQPNFMTEARLGVAPPAWPAEDRGLVFLWESDDGLNQVEDPETGAARACVLSPHGRAWLNRHFAMVLAGGRFVADDASVLGVLAGCRRTNELTLEATLTPRGRPATGIGRIVSFSSGLGSRNFTLGQEGDRLVLRLRTATTGQNADRPQLDLGPVATAKPAHVLVSYTPGRLVAWLDGRRTLDTDVVKDGFFHWQARPLVFGNEWQAERPWHGTLEAIAITNRFVGEDEALETYRRAAERLARRPVIPRLHLRATLVQRSRTPTLSEIAPYREALAVFEYAVDEVLAGENPGARIRVAHRVLLDGEALPIAVRPLSEPYELEVESFFDHPELESLYLSDTLPKRPGAPLFFSSEIEAQPPIR